jgi:hypothetical protein
MWNRLRHKQVEVVLVIFGMILQRVIGNVLHVPCLTVALHVHVLYVTLPIPMRKCIWPHIYGTCPTV